MQCMYVCMCVCVCVAKIWHRLETAHVPNLFSGAFAKATATAVKRLSEAFTGEAGSAATEVGLKATCN
jgi:hypothetical protein